jgi:hypothetical protein
MQRYCPKCKTELNFVRSEVDGGIVYKCPCCVTIWYIRIESGIHTVKPIKEHDMKPLKVIFEPYYDTEISMGIMTPEQVVEHLKTKVLLMDITSIEYKLEDKQTHTLMIITNVIENVVE